MSRRVFALSVAAIPVALAIPPRARAEAVASGKADAGDLAQTRMLSLPAATELTLRNGLRVVFQESHRQSQVAVVLAYDIGSRDDPVGYSQIAHLVEHLTYRGSKHLGPYSGMDLLERLGSSAQNGITHADFTAYFAVVPTNALAHALWVESERMAFTLEHFDEKNLDLERDTVRNELLMRLGPLGLLHHHAFRVIFGDDQPYAGSEYPGSDLNAIGLSEVRWFYQQAYRPTNARLVLVGDFETARARELVERYFARIQNPPGAPVRRQPSQPPFAKTRHVTLESNVFIEHLTVFWPGPKNDPRDEAAADLFARILGGGLRINLVDSLNLAAHVTLDVQRLDFGSYFVLSMELQPGTEHDRLESEIFRVFAEAPRTTLAASLVAARKAAILEQLLGLENVLDRAFDHLVEHRRSGHPASAASRIAELRSVTVDDILRQARAFAKERHVFARLERARPGARLPPGGLLEIDE